MVKLQKDQFIKTEWSGKWWTAKVKEIDASLVQMEFVAIERVEWIYRGSSRLGPLYLERIQAKARQERTRSTINAVERNRNLLTNVSFCQN